MSPGVRPSGRFYIVGRLKPALQFNVELFEVLRREMPPGGEEDDKYSEGQKNWNDRMTDGKFENSHCEGKREAGERCGEPADGGQAGEGKDRGGMRGCERHEELTYFGTLAFPHKLWNLGESLNRPWLAQLYWRASGAQRLLWIEITEDSFYNLSGLF